jgi:hypothetical protein
MDQAGEEGAGEVRTSKGAEIGGGGGAGREDGGGARRMRKKGRGTAVVKGWRGGDGGGLPWRGGRRESRWRYGIAKRRQV